MTVHSDYHLSPAMSASTIVDIDLAGRLPKVASGKVRDLFAVDDDTLLFVASDRISAYDVIMKNVWKNPRLRKHALHFLLVNSPMCKTLILLQGIPGKGALLTAMR